MTEATTTNNNSASTLHLGELKLRRLRAGESLGDDTATTHAAACPQCRARLKDLDDEQRRFEQSISFDRFATGVERETRRATSRSTAAATPARRWAIPALGALAAAAALVLVLGGHHLPDGRGAARGTNGIKGDADIVVYLSGGGGGSASQRVAGATTPEALAPGERVRIGYKAGHHRYLCAVSLDDHGRATALYPEAGNSLSVGPDSKTQVLPDSVEFTGAGAERLVVVLSDEPLDVAAVQRAALAAYRKAKGDVTHLPDLDVAGEQFHRTFRKP